MAGVFFLLVVGLAHNLRNPPEGWRPDGWTPSETHPDRDLTARQMLGTWQFYALWFILLSSTSIGLAAISEAAPYLERLPGKVGWPGVGAAVGIMGLCNGAGRLLSGSLSDRLGRRKLIVFVFALYVFGCAFLLAPASTYAQGFLGMCLAGLCFGGGIAMMPSTNADYFGAKNVGGNYGVMFTGFAISGFVGPAVVARVVQSAGTDPTPAYRAVFYVLAGIAVAGLVLGAALRPPKARGGPTKPIGPM